MNDSSAATPTQQLAAHQNVRDDRSSPGAVTKEKPTVEEESEESERLALAQYGTTHEACLLVMVLAGAPEEDGKSLEEIVERAAVLTDGKYDDPARAADLKMARFYLAGCSLIKYVPRAVHIGSSALSKVPFGYEATWRRTPGAQAQMKDVLAVLTNYLTRGRTYADEAEAQAEQAALTEQLNRSY